MTLSYYIFKYPILLHFSFTFQVEFHVPEFETALNKTGIVTRDINLRYEDIYIYYFNVLHDSLILIFTCFTSLYDRSLHEPYESRRWYYSFHRKVISMELLACSFIVHNYK
jgi:hypothetical protein